ncbi:MAG: VWA domain-containing protein [Dehalococcoidia bacterium]|nr:VWA domain-containing protein [Dehalococcoidia bacterium]
MAMRYRYSDWDGSQEIPDLDPDSVLDFITDDLMNFGDLQHALRNLLQRGMRNPDGQKMQGLRDLLQQLRQERRQTLERYDLSSAFDDIAKKLQSILEKERSTIDQRLADAGGAPQPEAGQPDDADGAEASRDPSSADDRPNAGERQGQATPSGQPRAENAGGPQEGAGQNDAGAGAEGQDGAQTPGPGDWTGNERSQFSDMLRNIAERKQNFLDSLPDDAGSRVKELQNYEFLNPDAQSEFQELMEMLKNAMADSFFKDISDQINSMSPQDMERLKNMVSELNQMLNDRVSGKEPDFDSFMEKYGDMFGDNPPQNLDELIERMQQQVAQMQSLMDSMPGDMRQQLQDLMRDKIGDPALQSELSELAANLEMLLPSRDLRNQYPFRGDEEMNLQQAMQLMDSMQDMDELERQLERTQYGGDISDIDEEKLEDVLGPEARETLDQLRKFLEVLEDAGYIRKRGNSWELTPRGTRKIGQKALGEIYQQLKKDAAGRHQTRERGRAGERSDDTKGYEFGDPFHLNLGETVMNSLIREGPMVPLRLDKDDFAVYRSELLTSTATVMMLDLSWSMALRGSFQAAKKVALALNNLIRSQFARDKLYIIGFSAYARELNAEQLPYVRWDESVLGTNMHHALMLAQKILARHNAGSRQIIMISDGEPTAHLEHGRSYFSYPPSPITIRETLKEVKRCTQKDITINTFMLDRNYYLKEFVNQVAKINKGRVFYTTPDKLGQYILVDYVKNKRSSLH